LSYKILFFPFLAPVRLWWEGAEGNKRGACPPLAGMPPSQNFLFFPAKSNQIYN